MVEASALDAVYDAGSDVLYISRGSLAAARGIEDGAGIVWRYARNGELIGATMLNFSGVWNDRRPQLAEELSNRFGVPSRQARSVLDYALKQVA